MTKKEIKKYDWKITAKKFGIIALWVLISGAISYMTENDLFLVLIPVLEAGRNYLKNK